MIGLDLRSPDTCSDSLRGWMRRINSDLKSFINKLTPEAVLSLHENNQKYLKNTKFKNDTPTIENTVKNEKSFINLGIPIIVVGCNSDYLQVNISS